jgi:endoglucanase
MFPHDRRSGGDQNAAPWPGYLVGGPWPTAIDWHDVQDDYETNEVAINWNGALIFALAAFVEPDKFSQSVAAAQRLPEAH